MQSQPASIPKISAPFAERLRHLAAEQTVRVIIMLETETNGKRPDRRLSREERQAVKERMCKSAEQALPDVEAILARFSGRRLAVSPDAFGCISVETTAEGISALADSERVHAVMEDQPIFALKSEREVFQP